MYKVNRRNTNLNIVNMVRENGTFLTEEAYDNRVFKFQSELLSSKRGC
jgi:hypothetical protein